MKVKIVCREERYKMYEEMLVKGGFIISNDASLLFKEEDLEPNQIIGKYNNRYEMIKLEDIIYIESYGHDIILHTLNREYTIKEKLYEIEGMYEKRGFIRINKSIVVNKDQIQSIKPSINTKFTLLMNNHSKLIVTRSYYYKFKKFIGF